MARSAYREAVESFEQALSALAHLPAQRERQEQAIDLRLALRVALTPLGDRGRVLVLLREAEALAEALDDPQRLGRVLRFLARLFHFRGAYDQAIATYQRALVLAAASGDTVLHALVNQTLGNVYQAQGDYRRAIDCFAQTMAFLDGGQRHERFGLLIFPAVYTPAHLAVCYAELGMFTEGRALAEEGLRLAEAVDHPPSLMTASWGLGLLALRQGDLARALPLLERAVRICQDAHLGRFDAMATALGAAYTLAGRLADAVPLFTQAMEDAMAMGMVEDQVLCSLSLGEAQMLACRLEEAQPLAKQALTLARAHQERGS
jgi:tetratricopeptide (TPR) repeat protein